MSAPVITVAPDDVEWARMVDRLTRRGFLGGIGALGATALLTACGTSGAGPESSAAQSTRTVTTPLGTYDIPTSPQRVVVIDSRLDLEPALALELPVIAHSYDAPAPWLPKITAEEIASPVNLEQVLRLQPDLIVCVNLDNEMWPAPALLDIAPVITTEFKMPWKQNMIQLADWLGRTETFDRAIATYDHAARSLVDRHSETLQQARIGIISRQPEEFRMVHDTVAYLPPQVYTDLGGTLGAIGNLGPTDAFGMESLDLLGDLDGILVLSTGSDLGSLTTDPLWQRIPAVSSGRVQVVEQLIQYGSVYSAIELVAQYDALLSRLG